MDIGMDGKKGVDNMSEKVGSKVNKYKKRKKESKC